MAHRELLTESQRISFHAPATDERGMVRHYTLSAEDLALVNRRRSDPNRLGFAVMLCYLRFPGRVLQQGERPPEALCAFVAEQTGDYHWEISSTLGPDQFRPLRTRVQSYAAAA
jgi:TnpA family transposase